MASTRQRIQDGIIGTLRGKLLKACNPISGYLSLVKPYNGEIDQSKGPDDFIKRIRGQFPCVLVDCGSADVRAESTELTRFARIITVELFIASDHMRTKEDRLKTDVVAEQDATADPGIWQIVEDVHDILAGNDLGLTGVQSLMPSREEVLQQEERFTLWRVEMSATTDAHVAKRDAGDFDWTEYALDANLDGDAVPTPPNPFVEADGDIT